MVQLMPSLITFILSNQLIGPRSMSGKHIPILSFKAFIRADKLPVIVQLLTCKAKTRRCSAMLAMNTPYE